MWKNEDHVSKQFKVRDLPGESYEYLSEKEGEMTGIDVHRHKFVQLMFFETNLGLKLDNTTRLMTVFM